MGRRKTSIPRNKSTDSLPFLVVDLEEGYHVETLQDQSTKLTNILAARTELLSFNQHTPDPPKAIQVEKESSGLKYWAHEMATAKEHGGDYKRRLITATRSALGAAVTFSVLVLPKQDFLGFMWIGNIFMHVNMQDSFGASVTSVIGFGTSTILTTLVSWPLAYFLTHLETIQACVLLPFVTFIFSFLIMSCPQLSSPNLMILVMFLIIATPVREDFPWYTPISMVGTYMISLLIALLVNIVPFPNFALRSTHESLKRLEKDLTMILLASKSYSDHVGTDINIARTSIASIEFMHTRISSTVEGLKKSLPATKVELGWMCKEKAAQDLGEWISHSEELLKPLKMLRAALMQRVLGEEHNAFSPSLRDAKIAINDEVGPARDRFVSAMVAAIAVCHAWADPSEQRTVLPDVQGELRASLRNCREVFHSAIATAAAKLSDNPKDNVPIFAHMTRRMSSFSALFALGESLLAYLDSHSWEAEEMFFDDEDFEEEDEPRCCEGVMVWFEHVMAYWWQPWLWHSADNFRLALKTSVGMVIASLFISITYLYKLSSPFSVWPGLTIASVNLGNTGSSFHKAQDRLFATLLAAAFAMLVSDLFPGNKDYIKIPEITVFTFAVIYLRNSEHAYKFTYAATSIGSMLYGSVKIDFDVVSYIPKRIELIFLGCVIFSIVELMLFPRSSRKMVEGLTFQYFLTMRDYLKQSVESSRRMEEYIAASTEATKYTMLMFDENEDPFQLKQLKEIHNKLKTQSAKMKKEIDAAMAEPNVGLALPLQPEAFRALVVHQASCSMQASMLLDAMETLSKYYQQEGHPVRQMNWPRVHTQFLLEASDATENACNWLKTIFPDGRIRAQGGNSVKAVFAAASFRNFEDVRLKVVADWSVNFQNFVDSNGFESSDPSSVMTLGLTTTHILQLCRHMQKAGKNIEEIAYMFPATR